MKRTREDVGAYRTAVIPVRLTPTSCTHAHEAAHRAAHVWNAAVLFQQEFWAAEKRDPRTKELRHAVAALDPELIQLHAHTKQAIVDDLQDAVATYRANKREGRKARAPWREKQYRPLTFTRDYGWRQTSDGRLNLSLGRGRPGIRLPLPTVVDPATHQVVPPELWGQITLCWSIAGRQWTLHIAVPTQLPPELNPDKILAIDEGIINAMATAVETSTAYEVTIVNGRHARSVKHRRNTAVADLTRKMSRCTKGSRQWRRYNKAKKHAMSHATRALRNFDHQVTRKVANVASEFDTGTIVVGDVRGIEQKTRNTDKRRFGKDQRRRLSQWQRGRQETYLAQKTGRTLTHVNEAYSSKTCPACLTRNRPNGRDYQCHGCGFTCHRDAVGAINILMRATHGTYRRIDPDKPVRVIYLRATPLTPSTAALGKAQNRASTTPVCS